MNEIERQDRIDRFVRGEMSQEEKMAFLKEMDADSSLAEDVNLTLEISQCLGALEDKKRQMAQWEEELHEKHNTANGETLKVAGGKLKWRVLPAVVGLAACLLVGFFFFWNTEEGNVPVVRGGASMEQINEMIDDGKYEEAIAAIDEILADTIIDKSLPEEEQEFIRAEQALNREKLGKLRERAVEKSKKE